MIIITHEGDTWRILSRGATRNGKVYCHLASTTRSRQQRNGEVPVQMADWIDTAVIEAAPAQYSNGPVSDGGMDPRDRAITEHYTDRAKGSHAAKAP